MKKLKMGELENLVLKNLIINRECRVNDHYLYIEICADINADALENFQHAFKNREAYGLPPFESVSRCRRKIQSIYPHLTEQKVKDLRCEKQLDYIDYALKNKNIEI